MFISIFECYLGLPKNLDMLSKYLQASLQVYLHVCSVCINAYIHECLHVNTHVLIHIYNIERICEAMCMYACI